MILPTPTVMIPLVDETWRERGRGKRGLAISGYRVMQASAFCYEFDLSIHDLLHLWAILPREKTEKRSKTNLLHLGCSRRLTYVVY